MIEAIGWDKIKDYFENQTGITFILGLSKKRLNRSVGEVVVSNSFFQGLAEGWEAVKGWSGRLGNRSRTKMPGFAFVFQGTG